MENREKILQCAEDLFYAKGYDAAGVQEIVERAGVTKPTLYYYFGSKRGLLEELLETRFSKVRAWVKEAEMSPGDIRGTLHVLADIYYRFFTEERKFYMLMMALFYSARENEAYQAVEPYLKELFYQIVEIFQASASMLGNMNGRQKQFAITYIGVLNQCLMLETKPEWSDGNEPAMNGSQRIHAAVEQFMYGIFS